MGAEKLFWGISTPDCCSLHEQVETTSHIIFNWRFSREVLIEVSKACDNVLWRNSGLPLPTVNGGDIRLGVGM